MLRKYPAGRHGERGHDDGRLEPSAMLVRLQTLGFAAVMVAVDDVLMFTARKARPDGDGQSP